MFKGVVIGVFCASLVALALAGAGSVAAAPPSLYKGSATRLLPSASEAGYQQLLSQSGSGRRASATYQTPGTVPQTLKLSIRVFKTETAATTSFNAASGALRKVIAGWKYKLRIDDVAGNVAVVARCRNLRVDTSMVTRATNPHQVAKPALLAIDKVVLKARGFGMSPCEGKGTPPPTTGTYYWSQTYAEQMVLAKVRIPWCNLYPNDSGCRNINAQTVNDAQCRGLDEKPGTFTYSRFTCDILVGYGNRFRGTIAVWPTGPTTLRWQII